MPNWCSCRILCSVFDDKGRDQLKEFDKILENKGKFSFGVFDPMPEELDNVTIGGRMIDGEHCSKWTYDENYEPVAITEEKSRQLKEKYGAADWYEWNMKHIGCKWDITSVYGQGVTTALDEISIYIETPWSPPEAGVEKLSERFPDIKWLLVFSEVGCAYYGWHIWHKVTEMDHKNIHAVESLLPRYGECTDKLSDDVLDLFCDPVWRAFIQHYDLQPGG